jgi:hypothetical protein
MHAQPEQPVAIIPSIGLFSPRIQRHFDIGPPISGTTNKYLPLLFFAARALVVEQVRKTGKRDRRAFWIMADFGAFPIFGEAGHGIPGQSSKVHRLQRRFHLHSGRAGLFLRQEVHQRPQALQAMQGQARQRRSEGASRNTDLLFRVRYGHDGAFQADPGKTRPVPILFPEAAGQSAPRGRAESRAEHRAGSGTYVRAGLKSRSPWNPAGNPAARTSVASCAQCL